MGVGGQCIIIKPDANLVVVTTSAEPQASRKIVDRYVLAAVRSSGALPANPKTLSELTATTHRLQHPMRSSAESLPAICERISGTRYTFERNALGYKEAAFLFTGRDSCKFILGSGKDAFEREVGLDNIYRITATDRQGHKPAENAFALKGEWVTENTLRLDSHEMGSALHFTIDFRFEGDDVHVSATLRPVHREFSFRGSASGTVDD